MRYLPLLLLLLAAPAFGQDVLFVRDLTTDITACPGTDEAFFTSNGASNRTYTLGGTAPPTDKNWNDTTMAGETRDGTWDCILEFDVSTGGGGPNRATIRIERVNSSCVVQETILEETTGTLAKGVQTRYSCTGASANITFAAGDGIMVRFWQDNGTRVIDFVYNGIVPNADSQITMPAASGGAARRVMVIGQND